MTSLIKNQLIKHLSKFTKNLKPEQISLNVLKGSSKLQFIEIDEDVLTEILELPGWLKIKKAYCTGVTVCVPWTKLKTSPIEIFIDEINVDVELTTAAKKSTKSKSSYENTSYGFINKTIENMSLYINTVEINFDSDVFGGSFMLQRLTLESRSPGWAKVSDLRQTRLNCPVTNKTLIFKQISWHLLRIEASAKTSKTEQRSKINAPLRLITSGGKIRIALKKHTSDGFVIHARIQTILDDILWVATLPQLRSALSFASFIIETARSFSDSEKISVTTTENQVQREQKSDNNSNSFDSSPFRVFFFDQTSYHVHIKKIDLHLCDDANSASGYPPSWDIESGAIQVTLIQVLLDIYPRSNAMSERSTWMRYPNPNPAALWIRNYLKEQLKNFQESTNDMTLRTRLDRCWPHMIGFFLVLRIYDVTILCVSDMHTKKEALTKFFESERQARFLPHDQQIVHIELGVFNHPLSDTLPAPKPAVFFQVGPFLFTFDKRTIRWSFYVTHILQAAIENTDLIPSSGNPVEIPWVMINLIMPRVVIEIDVPETDSRFPKRFIMSMSTLSVFTTIHTDLELLKLHSFSKKFNSQGKMNEVSGFYNLSVVIETSPIWIETDNGAHTKGLPLLQDVSVSCLILLNQNKAILILEPQEDVSVIVDHFQFIQVLRLSDILTEFIDLLSLDSQHYSLKESNIDIEFHFDIEKIQLHFVLPTGDVPSPYSHKPLSDSSRRIDELADALLPAQLSIKTTANSQDLKEPQLKIVPDEFPAFPTTQGFHDSSPSLDETLSLANSVEDEGLTDYEELMNIEREDIFEAPDFAEEAFVIDEVVENDRIYNYIMSTKINLFVISLERLQINGKIKDNHLNVYGRLKDVKISEELGITRKEIKQKTHLESCQSSSKDIWKTTFTVLSEANDQILCITADVHEIYATIDDEVISHLTAYFKNEEKSNNKLRYVINIHNSKIQIVDRKKLKPLRVIIKNMSIEQDDN